MGTARSPGICNRVAVWRSMIAAKQINSYNASPLQREALGRGDFGGASG